MTKKFCDRCESEVKDFGLILRNIAQPITELNIELCNHCAKSFRDWKNPEREADV